MSQVSDYPFNPWGTDFVSFAPRFSGGLSAISSSLIIYIIVRSETRLSSIYHRIMFGMSLADICGSIAMALTSLPMPSYMPQEEVFGYRWAGTRLGNTYTCNAQGFFSTFGVSCMLHYNSMLCVYYACAIAFTMKERNIKKYVEPILHGFPLLAGLSHSVPPFFYELYNPGIKAYPWCGPYPYPDECFVTENVTCIRGSLRAAKVFEIFFVMTVSYLFITITFSLGMVIWKVVLMDRMMMKISKLSDEHNHRGVELMLEKHRNTKAVLIQAFSYIVALLLGVIPPLLLLTGAIKVTQVKTSIVFGHLTLVLFPLQGFFNCLIFVCFKVYNYHRIQPDISSCQIIGILFCTSSHEPCVISRISIVNKDHEFEDECNNFVESVKSKVYNIHMKDESNEELRYRLGLMHLNPKVDHIKSISKMEHQNMEGSHTMIEGPTNTTNLRDDVPAPMVETFSSILSERQGDQSYCKNFSSHLSFSSSSSFSSSAWQINIPSRNDLTEEV